MIQAVDATAATRLKKGLDRVYIGYGSREEWLRVAEQSKLSLCPRGYGRSAFRVAEMLQLGHVPVYVYEEGDVPWVPYRDTIFQEVGFVVNLTGLVALLEGIEGDSRSAGDWQPNHSDTQIEAMEAAAVKYRESHFSPQGVLDQVSRFLRGGSSESDLRCQRLPASLQG